MRAAYMDDHLWWSVDNRTTGEKRYGKVKLENLPKDLREQREVLWEIADQLGFKGRIEIPEFDCCPCNCLRCTAWIVTDGQYVGWVVGADPTSTETQRAQREATFLRFAICHEIAMSDLAEKLYRSRGGTGPNVIPTR